MEDPYEVARDWVTTSIGERVSIDGPEIHEALLRRATDSDEITRGEALHGLARRHDARGIPFLITELRADGGNRDLFEDAALTFLGLGEEVDAGPAELIAALMSERREP